MFCFVLKMYFSFPQSFVFLFNIWSFAVFVIRDRLVKKKKLKKIKEEDKKKATCALNLYPCVIKYYLISLELSASEHKILYFSSLFQT